LLDKVKKTGALPILLFDSTEALGQEDFTWLEDHLLEPIVRDDKAIVTVSDKENSLRWANFSLKQRLIQWELSPFTLQQTEIQLKQTELNIDPKIIQDFTLGNPQVNVMLAKALIKMANGTTVDSAFIQTHSQEVAQAIDQIVSVVFFPGVSEGSADLIQQLSHLRQFNIESANQVVTNKSDGYWLRMFERLEETGLVKFNTQKGQYIIDPTLRRLINRKEELSNSEKYMQEHKKAAEIYRKYFTFFTRESRNVFPEYLYHILCSSSAKTDVLRLIESFFTENHSLPTETQNDLRQSTAGILARFYAQIYDPEAMHRLNPPTSSTHPAFNTEFYPEQNPEILIKAINDGQFNQDPEIAIILLQAEINRADIFPIIQPYLIS